MPLKAGKKMVNLGPHCCVSVGKLTMEMNPYRHEPNIWINPHSVVAVKQKQMPGHKGSRVYQVSLSGMVLCEFNIPKGTPVDEQRRFTDAAVDLVMMRWGRP